MEKLYIKKKNGRYEEYGLAYNNDIPNGIWLVQSTPQTKSTTSLLWKVGDLKRLVDVTTHAALQSHADDLAKYLMDISKENSPELEDAKQILGGYIKGPIGYNNISAYDLVTLFLRQLSLKIENQK